MRIVGIDFRDGAVPGWTLTDATQELAPTPAAGSTGFTVPVMQSGMKSPDQNHMSPQRPWGIETFMLFRLSSSGTIRQGEGEVV